MILLMNGMNGIFLSVLSLRFLGAVVKNAWAHDWFFVFGWNLDK